MEKIAAIKKVTLKTTYSSVALLILSFVLGPLSQLANLPNDNFHFGEYFASYTTLRALTDFIPLTIHGALDFIPAYLAHALVGEDSYTSITFLLYIGLKLLGCVLFLLTICLFTTNKTSIYSAAVAIPYFVGYRDFSIILLIYCYFLGCHKQNLQKSILYMVILSIAGSFNFFYSNNRGIIGTIAVGGAILFRANKKRMYLISGGLFIATVLGARLTNPYFGIENYLDQIVYFKKTAYQWALETDKNTLILSAWASMMLLFTLSLAATRVLSSNCKASRSDLYLLLFISLGYLQPSLYRADVEHIIMAAIPIIYNLYYWNSRIEKLGASYNKLEKVILFLLLILSIGFIKYSISLSVTTTIIIATYIFNPRMAIIFSNCNNKIISNLFLIACIFTSLVGITINYTKGKYDLYFEFVRTSGSNHKLLTYPITWVADELLKHGINCVFDLSNNGTINAATGLPACTRFSYLVYADKNHEHEMVNHLNLRSPKAIVYSTNFWSYSIDGRPMPVRFPDLDRFILSNYPNEVCKFGYCIKYK